MDQGSSPTAVVIVRDGLTNWRGWGMMRWNRITNDRREVAACGEGKGVRDGASIDHGAIHRMIGRPYGGDYGRDKPPRAGLEP